MSRCVIPDVPYIFMGVAAPRCHVACLRMILEFYGKKYTSSYLMNLSGYNYGFKYFEGLHRAFACPATPHGPWEILSFAAEKVGCRWDLFKDKPWEETWQALKEFVNQGIPVYVARLDMQYLWQTTQPTPHVVVLCGYDEEKGVVMVHDPALGETGEGIPSLPPNQLPVGQTGRYAEFGIAAFRDACAVREMQWAFSGKNGFVVLYPESKEQSVSWSDIIRRNADLTLGHVEAVVVAKGVRADKSWGADGMLTLASHVEDGFGLLEEPEELGAILRGMRSLAFRGGSAYRTDASAFLAGLAVGFGNPELREASYHLANSAVCFEQGLAGVDHILQRPAASRNARKKTLARISAALRKAAAHERAAGESLKMRVTGIGEASIV